MSYSTAVATALACIRKQPSPQTVTAGLPGAASLAPMTPPTPNPIAANPHAWSSRPRGEVLEQPVVVDAHVSEDDGVVGYGALQLGDEPVRPDGHGRVGLPDRDVRLPLPLPREGLAQPLVAGR